MEVKVEFFAYLREKMGTASKVVSFSGGTVRDLVYDVGGGPGGTLSEQVMAGGCLREMVKVLVNGRDVRGLDGLDTELHDGDVVSFFPPVAGG